MPNDTTINPAPSLTTAPTPAPTSAPAAGGTKLTDIISYAKANPETPYAQKAMSLIQSGAFDSQANKERLDLSWAGRPALQNTGAENISESLGERNNSIHETWDAYKKGDIGLPQAVINHVGQAVGGAFDVPLGIAKTAFGNPKVDIPVPKQISDMTDFLSEHLAKPEIATYENAGKLAQQAGDLYMQAHKETDPAAQAKLLELAKEVSRTADLVRSKADEISTSYRENAKTAEADVNIGTVALGGAEALGEKTATEGMVKDAITGEMKPTAATTIKDAARAIGGAVTKAAQPALNAAKKGMDVITEAAGNAKAAVGLGEKVLTPDEALGKIQDTIAPKLNAKEVKTAISEGRVARGKESTLFGKKPDIVSQSEEVQQAAKTIQKNIPGAENMDDVQLANALDGKIETTAKGLEGDMKNVPVDQSTTGKVVDAWKTMKKAQETEPEYDAFPGSAKFQAKFESYLKELEWDITDASGKFKAPSSKTLNDIWSVRKAYDASVPQNVKTATTASAPSLQWQKSMWLENRALLNAAINDTAKGLGKESQQAFSDMSDMYMSKQNILSKAKIDTEGKPGLLPSNKSDALKWGLSVGGGVIGLDILLHKLGL